ncbi:hypothetical protein AURDEDRAFT_163498 [Auricularia subglabra TFB-10046 SS5]|nr:hypothetical protein AURDEDRAFT_163498 [Auricularia subglabra TFB-10046 SS5]
MVLRKAVLREAVTLKPDDPATWTIKEFLALPCGRPSPNIKPVPISVDKQSKKDQALCGNAERVVTGSDSPCNRPQGADAQGAPLAGAADGMAPNAEGDPDADDENRPATIFLCASCGNLPGNLRCSNTACLRWYCTRPAGAKKGAIGCVSETTDRFICPVCASGRVRYRYYGSHPQHFVPDEDLDPVLLISILRPNATCYGPAELSVKFERGFHAISDRRFSKAHMYLGNATKALSPTPREFTSAIRKHMIKFPNSRVVMIVEAHSDITTGAFETGKGVFATWEFLQRILGPDSLEFIRASKGRKVLTLLTCGAAFTVKSSFASMQELLFGRVADIILGATGAAFVPTYCAGPLIDLTLRCIVQPGVDVATHAIAVFSGNATMVKRNTPIYVQKAGNTVLAETLHVNDRFTAWGFRLPKCKQCKTFNEVKTFYASGAARNKAKKRGTDAKVKARLPLVLKCKTHPKIVTKPQEFPMGVRMATDDASLLWHNFGIAVKPTWKWVKRGSDATGSDATGSDATVSDATGSDSDESSDAGADEA